MRYWLTFQYKLSGIMLRIYSQHFHFGAIASVKEGNLSFIRQGQGRTASGKPLSVISITRQAGDGYRFTLADRDTYSGVIASCLHTPEPKKKRRERLNAVERKPPRRWGQKLNREIILLERMKMCLYSTGFTQTATMQNVRQRCSGNDCSAGLRLSSLCLQGKGPISTRKCLIR